jgi:hypothetical protein
MHYYKRRAGTHKHAKGQTQHKRVEAQLVSVEAQLGNATDLGHSCSAYSYDTVAFIENTGSATAVVELKGFGMLSIPAGSSSLVTTAGKILFNSKTVSTASSSAPKRQLSSTTPVSKRGWQQWAEPVLHADASKMYPAGSSQAACRWR